jgi:hypothetical protein
MLKRGFLKFPLGLVVLLLWMSSCKTTSNITETTVARPISTNKLLKKVEANAFEYEYLSIKSIRCNFTSNKSKAAFKISLKSKRDENILVAIKKLNIPVASVLLTPDSIKFVNYIDRQYFIDDYSFLSDFLHIDLDFSTIQSVISNNVFSYRNDPKDKDKDYRMFKSFIQDNEYVLQSEKERRIVKIDEKDKTQKIERRLKRFDAEAFIVQRMFFSPDNFVLTQLEFDDHTNQRNMNLHFDDFVLVEENEYPSSMDMNFISPEEQINMKIKLSGFSTEELSTIVIKIPQKYERIHANKK